MTDRPRKKPPTYTPAPHLPRQLSERYELILKVLAGQMTVSEAARQLGLARNHFQHLMHRAQARLIEGLSPRPLGRPPKPASAKTLETENRRLRHRTEVLEQRLERQEKVLEATTELIRDRISTSHYRARKTRKTRKKSSSTSSKRTTPDDSDGPAAWLERALELRRNGLDPERAAALVGVSPSTLRRWSARQRIGRAPIGRRGPTRRTEARHDELACRVEDLVRQSRGLFGAEALSHAVPGVSRREAAAIKRATLTALERERKGALSHVVVTEPGVVRGFDAMHVCTTERRLYALCAGDGCIPFTTSIAVVARYDGPAVARALDQDFCEHGAPLVARMDRASCHQTDDVVTVCRDHRVLVLHGPPRHPRFYGQLERQNRDRRVWLQRAARPPPELLASELERNRVLLNSEWRRRSLDWLTAEERWKRRQPLSIDRLELSDQVGYLTARFAAELDSRAYDGLACRLAIEVALTQRGFLRREKREGC